MEGWIKLHRKSLDTAIFEDAELWHLWCRLLMMAAYNNKEVVRGKQVTILKPGQCIVGRKMLAELEGCSERKIRTNLKILEMLRMIDIKVTNRFSLVTIVNWAFYQGMDFESDQQKTNKRPTEDQQKTTNKNIKNIKNYKNSNWDEIEKDFLSN